MKKTIGALLLSCVLLFPSISMATDVGGIIDENTTWNVAGSPYNITSAIQIAGGVTLTIEPGVIVNGDRWNTKIEAWGNFIAIGVAKEWNKKLTKAQVLKCLDCHAPAVNFASEELAVEIGNMIVTAQDESGNKAGDEAKAQLARLNVGCLSCHNIKATSVARGLRGDPVNVVNVEVPLLAVGVFHVE